MTKDEDGIKTPDIQPALEKLQTRKSISQTGITNELVKYDTSSSEREAARRYRV